MEFTEKLYNVFFGKFDECRLGYTEKEKLEILMRLKGLTKGNLAKKIKTSKAFLVKVLKGEYKLTPEVAIKIYDALDQDPSLKFLVTKNEDFKSDRLYKDKINQLKDVYTTSSTEIKDQILGDLEKLAEKYSPKN